LNKLPISGRNCEIMWFHALGDKVIASSQGGYKTSIPKFITTNLI